MNITDEDTRIYFKLGDVARRAIPTFQTEAERAAFADAQLMLDIEQTKARATVRVRELQTKGRK